MDVSVLGDNMIDSYVDADIHLPGGAALCAEMCNAELYGFTSPKAKEVFKGLHIDNCIEIPKITRKVRFNNSFYGTLNYDVHTNKYPHEPEGDIIIYSDYEKGALWSSKLKRGAFTIVDPKCPPIERWIGCNIFKCNLNEAINFAGPNLYDALDSLKKELKCEAVVITLGKHGIIAKNNKVIKYEPKPIVVKNTIGAGDAMAAAIAIGISNGKGLLDAIIFACEEATEYVGRNRP